MTFSCIRSALLFVALACILATAWSAEPEKPAPGEKAPQPADDKKAAKKADPDAVACEACDSVGVEILERVPYLKWDFVSPPPSEFYLERSFALAGIPQRFAAQRPAEAQSIVVRAMASVTVAPGEHRLVVRSMGPARLYIDEHLIAETKAPAAGDKPLAEPGLRPLPAGQWERVIQVRLSPRPRSETPNAHTFKLVAFVPREQARLEWCVGIAAPGESFRLLSTKQNVPLTADGWKAAEAASRKSLEEVEREHTERK